MNDKYVSGNLYICILQNPINTNMAKDYNSGKMNSDKLQELKELVYDLETEEDSIVFLVGDHAPRELFNEFGEDIHTIDFIFIQDVKQYLYDNDWYFDYEDIEATLNFITENLNNKMFLFCDME